MKASAVKSAVFAAALSVALTVSAYGGEYRQSDAIVKENGIAASSRNSSLKIKTTREYGSQSVEAFISGVLDEDISHIDFVYNELYSEYGAEYGYVLDFSYAYGNGHAIISTADGSESIAEMDLENSSPYLGKDGKYIYASFDNYFVAQSDGDIVKLEANDGASGISAPMRNKDKKEGVAAPQDYNYSKGYLDKSEIYNFYFKYAAELVDKKNNCANAAGVIALNYWNTFHGNNLLNLEVSELINNTYNMNDVAAKRYMNIFYDYMNTNWIFGTGGTLPADVYKGFKKIITDYNYVARQSSVNSFDEIKNQINLGVPVFITSKDYYFTNCYDIYFTAVPLPKVNSVLGNYNFTIKHYRWYGLENSHTFVGYGYAEYTLYDKDGNESKIQFVKIADGWGCERYFNYSISNKMSMAAIKVSRC